YVKYIATREGSVPIPNMDKTASATKNQQELILSLLNDFPDSKELFEFQDYQKNPTIKNSTALITEILDRNMDRLTNRENYVGYLANRPGAVKFNSHGLFNEKDEPIYLEKVAKEIADHSGNVWTHVVSLRRDDAQKMGYDNLKAWRELVKRQIPNIAKNQKIDMKNLRWYAAFHDKKTNPHVHIIVYSTDEREGFLTNNGIEKIRSGFANDIYADELHHLYEQQTDLRNLLKKESVQLMEQLAKSISENKNFNAELMNLVSKLHTQLSESKGKKMYGYLKFDVKKTIDEIFAKLADNESIKKMYELWCEMEQQKHDIYSSAKVQFPNLVDNKEFKSVKNMIIQTVLKMELPTADIEIEVSVPDVDIPQIIEENSSDQFYLKWSDDYKNACKIIKEKSSEMSDFQTAERLLLSESENGNVLAMFELGKLYSMEKLGLNDKEKSFK
ncbi:MAG: relaxase MobL, partial [Ruminococcus sp.]|nr:relaxase MobL [Ruminococcus sp.]